MRNLVPNIPIHILTPELRDLKDKLLSKPVEHFKLEENPGMIPLINSMRKTAFQARELAKAADIYEKWSNEDISIVWALAGSLFGAGLRQIAIDSIRANMVDVIVCTGALIEQDMLEALGHRHYQCDGELDDSKLRELMIDRLYDHLIDEFALRQVDLTFKHISSEMSPGRYSSREFLQSVGEWLSSAEKEDGTPVEDSVLLAAFECGVPIFVPALNDSSVGVALVMQQAERGLENSVGIDSIKDFHELAELKSVVGDTGLVIVGGGAPKNYAQDMVVMSEMLGNDSTPHKFSIQLSVADERDGGLSGSTLKEAISWGKNSASLEQAMVWGEASITFPILTGYVYHILIQRKRVARKLALTFDAKNIV